MGKEKKPFDKNAWDNAYKKEHYSRITVLASKEDGQRIREDARRAGKTVTRYLLDAVAYYREAMR